MSFLFSEKILKLIPTIFLFSVSLLLIEEYEKQQEKWLIELSYFIIASVSIRTKNYRALYDFSINYGYYPIAKKIQELGLLDRLSWNDIVANIELSHFSDEEKTLFYQRMCFCFEIPSIVHDEYGNRLALSIGGVRAYNEINLYSKKSVERFKIFIGFRNRVCSNLMLTTDGLQDKIEVLSVQELYAAALNLFHAYNPSKDLHLLRTLGQMSISTSEFCQIIGRMRLYQALTPNQQKRLPRLLLGDSQINAACRAFISDVNCLFLI